MIDPPPLARILPEFLKFRFSLYIVKDDWPPPEFLKFRFSLHRNWAEFLKFRFSLYIVKDDWPPTPAGFDQNF